MSNIEILKEKWVHIYKINKAGKKDINCQGQIIETFDKYVLITDFRSNL